jgi:hypothetical protein
MSKIPDLGNIAEEGLSSIATKSRPKNTLNKNLEPEIDFREIDDRDNQFIWVALGTIVVILAGLFYFGTR